MAYDVEQADRLREILQDEPGISEQQMFGGLAFLLDGTMAVAVSGQDGLLLRVDPEQTTELTESPHVGPFVMRGKPLKGWLRVDPVAIEDDDALRRWVARGVARARELPKK